MFTSKKDVVLDRSRPFSQSALWDYQRAYFEKKGVNAWVREVPNYVTSNPFLARCYADMAVRLAQAYVQKHPASAKEPFYVMELGAGSGQLSYYVLKNIRDLKARLQLDELRICYLMTDFTESNLAYWKTHPNFQSYLDHNELDFALFDMVNDTSLTLAHSKKVLKPGDIQNPLTIFANYVFDTIPSDLFTLKNGEMFATLLTLSSKAENVKGGKPISMKEMVMEYKTASMPENYYPEGEFNEILETYRNALHDTHILFPVCGLRSIANLKALSNGKIFLITSDKGHMNLKDLEGLGHPHVDFHGSFSLMVNFHAISSYFEKTGGRAIIQSPRPGIKTLAFCHGFEMSSLPEFSFSVYENIERLSPGDYFVLHRNIRDNFVHAPLESLVGHLAFAQWDPHIFRKLSQQIIAQIPKANKDVTHYLTSHLKEIALNFYYMPQAYDVLFDIGLVFHALRRYKEALPYYEQSQHYFGEKFNVLHNLAVCEYNTGLVKRALDTFTRALALNPDAHETRKYIEYIQNTDGGAIL